MFFRSLFRRLSRVALPPADHSQDNFRAIVERSSDVICHLLNGTFTYISPSAGTIFGWSPSDIIGTDGWHLIYEPDLPVLQQVLARRRAGASTDEFPHQLRVICGDGTLKWSETAANYERDPDGKETHTVIVIRDISERKRLEAELASLAHKDGLTGLANRRAFDEAIECAWRETLQRGGGMALLLLDIDYFKQFNDAFGHQVGDDCLRSVAAVLSRHARSSGSLACRYGGEEFAVIMGDADAASAISMAESIRSSVEALNLPHATDVGSGHVTISIGVATAIARVGGTIRMPEGLLLSADHALYKAKGRGRNRVEQSVLIAPSAS